jgi:hypothetical protein
MSTYLRKHGLRRRHNERGLAQRGRIATGVFFRSFCRPRPIAVSVYILRWHGHGVTIDRVERVPRGFEHFGTWETAKERALDELRERAEDFEARAKKLRTAIATLENAQEGDAPPKGGRKRSMR